MYAGLTFLLLLLCVVVHEFGHAFAMIRCGIKVKEIGIGFKTSEYLGFSIKAPSWLPCERLGFHLLLLGGYTVPADDQVEKLKTISYWDYANIMGSGIWANLLMALAVSVILVLTSPLFPNERTWKALGLITVIGVALWFGQRIFTSVIFPLLGVFSIYVMYSIVSLYGSASVGGPVEIAREVANQTTFVDSLLMILNISVSLALLNSLPISPMDGGKLYANIIGKISPTAERVFTMSGTLVFLILILLILGKDFIGLRN